MSKIKLRDVKVGECFWYNNFKWVKYSQDCCCVCVSKVPEFSIEVRDGIIQTPPDVMGSPIDVAKNVYGIKQDVVQFNVNAFCDGVWFYDNDCDDGLLRKYFGEDCFMSVLCLEEENWNDNTAVYKNERGEMDTVVHNNPDINVIWRTICVQFVYNLKVNLEEDV